MCPSHYSELFRRYIKLISPSTIWTKVLSFTPFLCLSSTTPPKRAVCNASVAACSPGSWSRPIYETHRKSTLLSAVPLKKKSCSVATEAHWRLRGLVELDVLSVPLVPKPRSWGWKGARGNLPKDPLHNVAELFSLFLERSHRTLYKHGCKITKYIYSVI